MFFPNTRLRRMRSNLFSRELISENYLSIKDLIYPIFICDGHMIKQPVKSMPGIYRLSLDLALETCQEVYDLGIPLVALFPVINKKKKVKLCKRSVQYVWFGTKIYRKNKKTFAKFRNYDGYSFGCLYFGWT